VALPVQLFEVSGRIEFRHPRSKHGIIDMKADGDARLQCDVETLSDALR
jgi:hypothetical protein